MEVKAARKVSVQGRLGGRTRMNEVCVYWLRGNCNKNPCPYLHPPRRTEGPPRFKKNTWRNPSYHATKNENGWTGKGGQSYGARNQSFSYGARNQSFRKKAGANRSPQSVLTNERAEPERNIVPRTVLKKRSIATTGEGGQSDGARNQSIQKKATANCSPQKDLTIERAELEKKNVQRASPVQCKYWITDNCVYGDKCKDLHSWFSGSGFTMLPKLKGHSKSVTGIALPSGSDKLYSVSKDKSIRVWDCYSGQCVSSFDLGGEVGCLVSEGPWLFVGLPNALKAWNLQNQAEFALSGPVGQVHCIVVDKDMLFAGIEDGAILVWKWNPASNMPEQVAMLKEHNGAVCSLVIGANHRLYSGSRDSTIKVWDIENMKCMQTLSGHKRDVMSVLCWDSYLVSASLDNTLKVWAATESGDIEVVYEMKDNHGVIALCGIRDAEEKPILLCSFNDNTVRLYDLPSFAERGRIFSKCEVQVIQIGIQGLFFTGDATGEVSVWKLLEAPRPSSSTPSKTEDCPAARR